MVIFHSYVSLPEGINQTWFQLYCYMIDQSIYIYDWSSFNLNQVDFPNETNPLIAWFVHSDIQRIWQFEVAVENHHFIGKSSINHL